MGYRFIPIEIPIYVSEGVSEKEPSEGETQKKELQELDMNSIVTNIKKQYNKIISDLFSELKNRNDNKIPIINYDIHFSKDFDRLCEEINKLDPFEETIKENFKNNISKFLKNLQLCININDNQNLNFDDELKELKELFKKIGIDIDLDDYTKQNFKSYNIQDIISKFNKLNNKLKGITFDENIDKNIIDEYGKNLIDETLCKTIIEIVEKYNGFDSIQDNNFIDEIARTINITTSYSKRSKQFAILIAAHDYSIGVREKYINYLKSIFNYEYSINTDKKLNKFKEVLDTVYYNNIKLRQLIYIYAILFNFHRGLLFNDEISIIINDTEKTYGNNTLNEVNNYLDSNEKKKCNVKGFEGMGKMGVKELLPKIYKEDCKQITEKIYEIIDGGLNIDNINNINETYNKLIEVIGNNDINHISFFTRTDNKNEYKYNQEILTIDLLTKEDKKEENQKSSEEEEKKEEKEENQKSSEETEKDEEDSFNIEEQDFSPEEEENQSSSEKVDNASSDYEYFYEEEDFSKEVEKNEEKEENQSPSEEEEEEEKKEENQSPFEEEEKKEENQEANSLPNPFLEIYNKIDKKCNEKFTGGGNNQNKNKLILIILLISLIIVLVSIIVVCLMIFFNSHTTCYNL